MRVIVVGAGEIGWYVAEQISAAGHDVSLIDRNEEKIRRIETSLDVHAVWGTGSSTETLLEAGVDKSAMIIAVTESDETNLVSTSLGRRLGARLAVARVDEVLFRKSAQISYSDHFGIDVLVSPEMLAALELASSVRNPSSLAVEHFARGALEMQQVLAAAGAKFLHKPLRDLELPRGVRLASIKRGEDFIIPKATDQIEPGDMITIVGETEQVMRARAGFEARQAHHVKVVIMGGGHTTISLARRLRGPGFRLTVIERNSQRCQRLASLLPNVTILNGDGTDIAFLREERVQSADFFVSTTDSDEANIMSAMQAKHLGAEKVLVLIHRPDYADLMERSGIDRAVSPRAVMGKEVLNLLRQDNVSTLSTLGDGKAEIVQMTVKAEGFVDKSLRNLVLPGGALILTLQRGRISTVPAGDTEFKLGDVVLVICRPEHRKSIARMIVGFGA